MDYIFKTLSPVISSMDCLSRCFLNPFHECNIFTFEPFSSRADSQGMCHLGNDATSGRFEATMKAVGNTKGPWTVNTHRGRTCVMKMPNIGDFCVFLSYLLYICKRVSLVLHLRTYLTMAFPRFPATFPKSQGPLSKFLNLAKILSNHARFANWFPRPLHRRPGLCVEKKYKIYLAKTERYQVSPVNSIFRKLSAFFAS